MQGIGAVNQTCSWARCFEFRIANGAQRVSCGHPNIGASMYLVHLAGVGSSACGGAEVYVDVLGEIARKPCAMGRCQLSNLGFRQSDPNNMYI